MHDVALRPFSVLSICSGIGALDAGIKYATGGSARTVCFLEGEAYAAAVLVARMQSKHLDTAPIWSDVKTFDAKPWRGKVDCIVAGYPCQPFSAAGKRQGDKDPRHLWPFIRQHIATIQPALVFCENVANHLSLGFREVCDNLSSMDYAIEAGVFSAEECGAPHRRERLFFLAHTNGGFLRQAKEPTPKFKDTAEPQCDGEYADVADADRHDGRQQRAFGEQVAGQNDGLHAGRQKDVSGPAGSSATMADANRDRQHSAWAQRHAEALACFASKSQDQQHGGRAASLPPVDGQADGSADLLGFVATGWGPDWERDVPRVTFNKRHRIDALRALGNAVVPATAALAWRTLVAQATQGA